MAARSALLGAKIVTFSGSWTSFSMNRLVFSIRSFSSSPRVAARLLDSNQPAARPRVQAQERPRAAADEKAPAVIAEGRNSQGAGIIWTGSENSEPRTIFHGLTDASFARGSVPSLSIER